MNEEFDENIEWSDIPGIPEFLIKNLRLNGFERPFPVQIDVITNFFNNSSDLAIGHPTGSGKTLSYLIPIISSLYKRIVPRTRAIVVVPNRELATQVFNVASCLINGTDLSISVLSTPQNCGIKKKGRPYDILISTAAGLSSYLVETNNELLAYVEIIVLDEGDLILNQPIENWLQHVTNSLESGKVPAKFTVPIKSVPDSNRKLRKILCSATLSTKSKQTEDFGMYAPTYSKASDRSRYVVPQGIHERFVVVQKEQKTAALLALCNEFNFVLCFVSTTKRSGKLASIMRELNRSLSVIEFSSSSSTLQRKKALENIVEGQTRLIIATDSLARGVDLPFLNVVVNYDIPYSTRTYIHRMGRTARGGAEGYCFTLVLDTELLFFRNFLEKIDGSHPIEENLDFKKYINNHYLDLVKKLDRLKVKTNAKVKNIPNLEYESDEQYDEE